MEPRIRPGRPEDTARLTALAFASKHVWHDPECWFETWKDELTITSDYLARNTVLVGECGGTIAGFCALVEVPVGFRAGKVFVRQGLWLDHLFVDPSFIGMGIGTALLGAARHCAAQKRVSRMLIFSDPHAAGFYEKRGAVRLGLSPSSIEGRMVPVYALGTAEA